VNSPDRLALQIDLQDGRRKSFHLYMRCKQVNSFKDRLEGFLETHKDGPGSIKRHRQWNTAKSLLDLPYAEISKCMSMMRDRRSRACSVLLGHISRHICPDSVANLDEMHVYSRVFRWLIVADMLRLPGLLMRIHCYTWLNRCPSVLLRPSNGLLDLFLHAREKVASGLLGSPANWSRVVRSASAVGTSVVGLGTGEVSVARARVGITRENLRRCSTCRAPLERTLWAQDHWSFSS
jgi:hypothetical protein